MIFGNLNINSLRYKYSEVHDLIASNIDILFLSETKLDDSWPSATFCLENYSILRQDRNGHGGGLLAFIRSDIPHRRCADLEKGVNGIEMLAIEVCINKRKLLFVCLYKPPKTNASDLIISLENICNLSQGNFYATYLVGDMNIDMLIVPNALSQFADLYGFKNIIKDATCFKGKPSCLDVIVTDKPGSIAGTLNFNPGLSDFHHCITAATKVHAPLFKPRMIMYRSYKHFSEESFKDDIENAPLHVCDLFDDVDDSVWFHNTLIKDVLDEHAPIKKKYIRSKQAPFMNGELRKAINVKAMLHRKYLKFKDDMHWKAYKKQRNLVTAMKKRSLKTYFEDRCENVKNGDPRMFWQIIKPFVSDKNLRGNSNIMLMENESIVSNDAKVCDIFNEYFANVTDSIGTESILTDDERIEDIIDMYSDHESVVKIQSVLNHVGEESGFFSLKTVSPEYICKKLKCLQRNKATGYDGLPARIIKMCADILCHSFTVLVNRMICQSNFPQVLKLAELAPVFKKADQLNKSNYRPVSVLTICSKIFEIVMFDQVNEYMICFLSKYLCAFRQNYGCQDVLLKVVEDIKDALDKNEYTGCMLMDLSKAFDCLPHRLLIAKLYAYGISLETCKLFKSYLCNRYQRVKLGTDRSDWTLIKRGVPQGSILGPALFNIFINDLLFFLDGMCHVYNYADDNTISVSHKDMYVMKRMLKDASDIALHWFRNNQMQANPEKFQGIIFSRKNIDPDEHVLLTSESEIQCSNNVKLLGIDIDNKLSFIPHVRNICKKAGRYVNVLSRMKYLLNEESKTKILNAFVLSNLNYCPLVWHECSVTSLKQLEKVQERALRFTTNDSVSAYHTLLEKCERNTLFFERIKLMLVEVYKVINNIEPCLLSHLYSLKSQPYDLRNCSILVQPEFSTISFGKKSIKYKGAKLWNLLPNHIKEAENINKFRKMLQDLDACTNFIAQVHLLYDISL